MCGPVAVNGECGPRQSTVCFNILNNMLTINIARGERVHSRGKGSDLGFKSYSLSTCIALSKSLRFSELVSTPVK